MEPIDSKDVLKNTPPQDTLKRFFGHSDFRSSQKNIIEAILAGKNTLVIMPTGGGKSLCYQLPALIFSGTTIVVSPLISLMQDQVEALKARRIPASFINSTLTPQEQNMRIAELRGRQYKILYVAPERFKHPAFLQALREIEVPFFAIDEAHCISQWGHDFRPDYLRLKQAIDALGTPIIGAFTATATPEVREDICRNLGLESPQTFVTGFARPNLEFSITRLRKDAEKYARLSHLIETHKTGIIYCATRKQVEAVSERLDEWDITYVSYHGGMSDEARKEAQNKFTLRSVDVAVATNAFGMGIDRSDLRFIAHFQMPGSIEAYYQEAGRAGRDGNKATCELLYSYRDKRIQEFFIEGSNPLKSFIMRVYQTLLDAANTQNEIHLSIDEVTERMGASSNPMAVSASLSILSRLRFIERFNIAGMRIKGTRLLQPHKLPQDLSIDDEALREKERRDRNKLEAVIRYAETPNCRQAWILEYFGEANSSPCKQCDYCKNPSRGLVQTPAAKTRSLCKTPPRIPNDDELILVQKVLSGIARMSFRSNGGAWIPRFGKKRAVEALRGSRNAAILEARLDQLSTYGLLKQESEAYLLALLGELEQSGLVQTINRNGYDLITLTTDGTLAMKGQLRYRLAWPERHKTNARHESTRATVPAEIPENFDENLYEALRAKRQMLAQARHVPVYAILPNHPLRHLASRKPLTLDEAAELPGIGPTKLKTVVPAFLKVIKQMQP
tara:strand:- start:836 stop:3031 length:2196 start_codon:yes stop_codon:yes gene_type:complete